MLFAIVAPAENFEEGIIKQENACVFLMGSGCRRSRSPAQRVFALRASIPDADGESVANLGGGWVP